MNRALMLTGACLFGVGLTLTYELVGRLASPDETIRYAAAVPLAVALSLTAFGVSLTGLASHQGIQRREREQQYRESVRLHSTFLRLLHEGNGDVSVLQFAIETGLEGKSAKAYLDEQAKAFNARYDVTHEGKLAYFFDLDGIDLGALPSENRLHKPSQKTSKSA